VHVRDLLTRAAELYDAPGSPLRTAAAGAALGGFSSGAEWMRLALETLRGRPCPLSAFNYQRLGLIKYGVASGVALLWAVASCNWNVPWLVPLAAVAFYAVEAQMVFLFPLALDGSSRPFDAAWRWTRRAGGILAVMRVVVPLACTMLFGGLAGRGFLRCWCLGCLAVCLWYEDLRNDPPSDGGAGSPSNWALPVRCSSGGRASTWVWPGRCACFTQATCTWAGGGRGQFPNSWSGPRIRRRRT
jgi:hypothetical protein